MKTILTPQLLGFLIEKGFTYCLSKTQVNVEADSLEVVLTPVKVKPLLGNMPSGYDTCFKITREPMKMAYGNSQAEVYMNLDFKKDKKLN